eukprot:3244029-Prymnesium_polylepis.1
MPATALRSQFSDIRLVGRGMINAIGLFILIAFLGYGLVEVPRMLWNKGNTDGQVRYLKFRVATQSEALQNARRYAPQPPEPARPQPIAIKEHRIVAVRTTASL